MINLTIIPAKPVLRAKSDGTGYDFERVGNHHATLKIGNVSLAFDGRNNWDSREANQGEVIELMEYHDDPVRLNGTSVEGCEGHNNGAERLLHALAADLGYFVRPVDDNDNDDDYRVCSDCGRVISGDDDCGYCADCAARNE